jgi:signal transduction histidine kinase
VRFGVNIAQLTPYLRREIISIFNGEDPQPGDYKVILEDGSEMWTRLHAAELDDADIPGLDRVVAVIDITELKQAQARLAELLRSKDEFVAAVSHELRTPLTSVLGFAEVLMTDSARLSNDDRELLMLLQNQAYDMSHIVEDLLVAARAEIGTVPIDSQPLELAPLINDAVGDLGHRFKVHAACEPIVHADRVRVGQILRNLITNATRYGGEARSVYVSTNGTRAIVEVRDNGCGVAPDKRERIFEPYTRAHNRPGMTASVGLGLSVSRQLAELMGGGLEYARDNGESVFRLTLPLAEEAATDVA